MAPTFSGHETFTLRSSWLKKGYDMLRGYPDLFTRPDAYVLLGVGKNMAQSIRYWGRVCGMYDKQRDGSFAATALGDCLLADDGWDPFLVTPLSAWLLHYQLAAHREQAYTWYYTFNELRGGEFAVPQLVSQMQQVARDEGWKVPSNATLGRDIDCLVRCYLPPAGRSGTDEDVLLCPLYETRLLQALPTTQSYRLTGGEHPTLPDALIAYSIHALFAQRTNRTLSFHELAYLPRSPGRVFRLDEDALLARLTRLEAVTDGAATFSDQAGIRQVAWTGAVSEEMGIALLARGYAAEALEHA